MMESQNRETVESEAKWQRHVMEVIWTSLVFVIAISIVLVFGRAHGLFGSSGKDVPPPAPWPSSLQ